MTRAGLLKLTTCDGKHPFASVTLAMQVAARRRKARAKYQRRQEAYKCLACGMWHIGRKAKP